MARSLLGLIRASGYSGVAGQSFRNHVTGSGSGARMTDYILSGLSNWASGDYTPGMNVASGGSVHFTFDFDGQSHFIYIRRPASEIYAVNTALADPTAEVFVDSATYPASPFLTGNSLTVRFLGRLIRPSGMTLVEGWYTDFSGAYPAGEEPPDNNDYQYEIGLFPTPPDTSGFTAETFDIVYPNDPGSFNPEYRHSLSLNVGKRAGTQSFDIQWSFDGTFTDQTAFDNSQLFQFMANRNMAPITVFYRWRVTGTGPGWTVSASTTAHFHN